MSDADPSPGPKPSPILVLRNVSDPGTAPRTVRCVYQFSPAWYTIHWGDTTRTPAKPSRFERHVYSQAGLYMVSIVLDGDVKPHVMGQIDVRDELEPELRLVKGTDPRFSDLMYILVDKHHGDVREPYYDIDWGDGETTRNLLAMPGTKPVWHGWKANGDYVVKVTDKSTGVTKRIDHTVTDPDYDPNYTIEYDESDPTLMTAKVTVTRVHTDGETKMNWDDGSDIEDVPNTVGTVITHTYADPNFYVPEMFYPGDDKYKRTAKFFAAGGEELRANPDHQDGS